MEKTLVLLKPEIVKRGLMGKLISIYEEKGLKIEEMKLMLPTRELLEEHYAEHKEKPFFEELVEYMTSGKVCVMEVSGEKAVETVRKLNGKTDPLEADAGSIRGRFAVSKSINAVHSSDCAESAERELNLWFSKG